MEYSELLSKRRSVRSYTERGVTKDEIDSLLNAATAAPNACNFQSWHFYVVTDSERIKGFSGICAEWATTAPVIIVIATDADRLQKRFGSRGCDLFAIQDTALAAENILLKAVELGLGGCIIGYFDEDKCRNHLSVPDNQRPVMIIPIGEPDEDAAVRSRKPLSEVVTYL